jgi:hypothetical protein
VLPGASMCFGMDSYALVQQWSPTCFPSDPVLVDRTKPGATTRCGQIVQSTPFVAPTFINCVSTPLLAPTRFSDGLDNIFYLLNAASPSLVDMLASAPLPLLQKYAEAHTDAAHAAAEPYTSACFRETLFPNAFTALAVVLFNLLLAAAALAWKLVIIAALFGPLALAAYSVWAAWRLSTRGSDVSVAEDVAAKKAP